MEHRSSLGVHPDTSVTARHGCLMGTPTSEEYNQDQSLRAFQVAAMSGFFDQMGSTRASCLSVCNSCREHVPLECVTIKDGVPPSILALVWNGVRQVRYPGSSRLVPYRRALRVHIFWPFIASTTPARFALSDVKWPARTKEVSICTFNGHMDAVTLPAGLERLRFGLARKSHYAPLREIDIFNTPLEGMKFPGGLREIFLGDSFNQPIEGIDWPTGLERLSLPGFNQSMHGVQWSPGLKSLEFVSPSIINLMTYGDGTDDLDVNPDEYINRFGGYERQGLGRFNQPLHGTLPSSLETVWLSEVYDRPLDSVAWPSGVAVLGLPFCSRRYSFWGSITFPPNLQHLFIVNKPLEGMAYPRDSKMTILNTYPGIFVVRGNLNVTTGVKAL